MVDVDVEVDVAPPVLDPLELLEAPPDPVALEAPPAPEPTSPTLQAATRPAVASAIALAFKAYVMAEAKCESPGGSMDICEKRKGDVRR